MASIAERAYRMTDHQSTITTLASYATSATLVIGKGLDFLNANAAACGVILGLLTFIVNYRAKRALLRYYQDTSARKRKDDMDAEI